MALKRKTSECDDAYSDYEDNCGLQSLDECSPTPEGGSTRKRRRGLIEKRRRDRINDSLGELKRLVPSAVEKSTSTKLEKAEILQMTVEYLKSSQHTRSDYPDPRVAMDYQNLGFRDCIAELSRYLVTVEGMDLQDPLRLRLMSHLHSFISRGTSGASLVNPAAMAGSWQPSGYNHQYHVQAPPPSHTVSPHKIANNMETSYSLSQESTQTPSYSRGNVCVGSSQSTYTPPTPPMYTTNAATAAAYSAYSTFSPAPLSLHHPGSGVGGHGGGLSAYQTTVTVNGKPYRPWGTEMAY